MSCAQSIRWCFIVCLLLCGREPASALAILGNRDSFLVSYAFVGNEKDLSLDLIQESPPQFSDDYLGFVDGPNLYAYCNQNAWSKFDPDGLSVWLKAGKLALKGGDMALTVAGFVDDWHTFTNPESTFLERFGASWSMLSEVLPVSVDDVKGGISITIKAVHSLEESKNASKLSKTEQKIVKTEKEVAKESEKQVERIQRWHTRRHEEASGRWLGIASHAGRFYDFDTTRKGTRHSNGPKRSRIDFQPWLQWS
jgi:hypothetical protein